MIPWLVRSADHWLMTRINLMHPTQAAKGRANWRFLHYLCVVLISTRTSTYLKQIVVPASPASPRSPGWAQHAAARCSQACYYLRRTAETSFAKSHRNQPPLRDAPGSLRIAMSMTTLPKQSLCWSPRLLIGITVSPIILTTQHWTSCTHAMANNFCFSLKEVRSTMLDLQMVSDLVWPQRPTDFARKDTKRDVVNIIEQRCRMICSGISCHLSGC